MLLLETHVERQRSIGVIMKFSENMQQIYRRIPMPRCDFNKVALQQHPSLRTPPMEAGTILGNYFGR